MKFKSDRIEKQFFNDVHIFLQKIVVDAHDFCVVNFGKELTVTRCIDPVAGESGVHLDGRGVDCRNEFEGVEHFTDSEVEELVNHINEVYQRYDGYTTVKMHSFKGAPMHFHFQLAPSILAYVKPKTSKPTLP